MRLNLRFAFTLAEVLITLGVIGVVSAITLPGIINRVQEGQYDRARQKILASVGEAGRIIAIQGNINNANNTADFVKNYLSKQIKIVKFCDSSDLKACGLSESFNTLDGKKTMNMPVSFNELSEVNIPNSQAKTDTGYGFLTANGYAFNIFYNSKCIADENKNINGFNYVCFNAIYDMNGLKKPNQVGKDIGFVTVLYPNESTKAVLPKPTSDQVPFSSFKGAQNYCSNLGKYYYLPDKEELISMTVNGYLIGFDELQYAWSSTTCKDIPTSVWRILTNGNLQKINKTSTSDGGRCVIRR